jgi:PAS domain-containing protein
MVGWIHFTFQILAPSHIGHVVLDASGNVVEFMGAVTDITCRKQAGQALRRSEKELREVIDTIRALVWIALPDGSNVSVQVLERAYGSLRDRFGLAGRSSP